MSKSNSLAKRFKEVTLDGKLVAFTNIKEQLSEVTLDQANEKISSLNTIAALTFHINYYISGVLQVFDGGELTIRDKFSWDMQPLNDSSDWENLKGKLFENAENFASHLDQMNDEKLASEFVKHAYGSYEKNINVMIEHCYYHLGQIVIIKKMILL